MAGINVPFPVIIQKLNDYILGFNATKNLVQNRNDTELIVNLFQKVFGEVGRDKMERFVELIQQSKVQDKETEVKVKGKDVIIPSGKTEVNRKTNLDLIEKQRATIFQQIDAELPEGIHCADSVVLLKSGIKICFRICIINFTFRNDIKDWKIHQQTETINNQCIRNKWKMNTKIEEKDSDHQHQLKVLEKINLSGFTCNQRK